MLLNRFKIEWAVIFIGIVALFPFLILCFYNHPTSDDYGYTNIANKYGYWGSHAYWYNNVTGCLFRSVQLSISPLLFDFFLGYKIFPFIFFIIFLLAIYYFITSIAGLYLDTSQKIVLVLSIIFIHLYYAPRISHQFYWLTGIAVYQTPTILTLLFVSILLKLQNKNTHNPWLTALAMLLLVCILHGNETYMVLIVALLLFIALIKIIRYKRLDKILILLLIVALIGTLSVLLSPGVYIRQNEYPEIAGTTNHLVIAFKGIFLHMFHFIYTKSLLIVLFSVILFPVVEKFISRTHLSPFINPLISFFLTIIFPMIIISPICWLIGGVVLRVSNIAYFFFMLGFFYSLFCFWAYLKNKYNINLHGITYRRTQWFLVCMIPLSLLFPNNIRAAYADLILGRAAAYDAETNHRYELIKMCRQDTCVVPPIYARPASLWESDITTDANDWINDGYQVYFEKKAIIVPSEENNTNKPNSPQ